LSGRGCICPGGASFGANLGDEAGRGVDAEIVSFLDFHLKGRGEAGTAFRLFDLGARVWRDFETVDERLEWGLFLHSDGRAAPTTTDGALVPEPGADGLDFLVHDPWRPAPSVGLHWVFPGAFCDRREADDVLPNVPDDGRFRRELLVRQQVVAIVNADSVLAAEEYLTCEQLITAPLIFRTRGSSTQRVVDRAFHSAGLSPVPLLTLDTRDGVYEAVANGVGVGFMWREGTGRTDTIRRIPVREMDRLYDEVVFAPRDGAGKVSEAFFAAAKVFGNSVLAEAAAKVA
jgi:hypothetical protein